ncbi:hypothetical protein XCR1_1870018 [Xenorhabdus cabanillasii JM26]|uniref:Transposase n=1 Tax=Xenorhabdus cabanillasii JM26 TaxID=1427517 RepID=W1IYF1_9GAMM|nr:hypothetical protein XCR1_1870018 [Xenorhabdus cabanillasii JM26]
MLPERIKNQAVYICAEISFTDDNRFQVVKKFLDVISKVFLT